MDIGSSANGEFLSGRGRGFPAADLVSGEEAMMTTMRRIAAFAAGAAAFGALIAAAEAQTVLRVGINPTGPFGGDPPGGYYVELMNAIATEAGLGAIEFFPMPFGEHIGALTGNRTDVIAAPMLATDERRAMGIGFTPAVVRFGEGLAVAAADPTPYTALADFLGQPMGTIAGSTAYINLLTQAGITDIRTYPTNTEGVQALAAGEIKGFITAAPSFQYAQQVQGLFPEARFVDTYVVALWGAGHIGVRAADVDLLARINAAFAALLANGTVAAIAARWNLTPPA